MQFGPIVAPNMTPANLSAGSAVVFAAVFALVAFMTFRRPVLGVSALILLDPFAFYRWAGVTSLTLSKVALVAVIAALLLRRTPMKLASHRPAQLLFLAFALVAACMALSLWHAHTAVPALREVLKWIEYTLTFAACALAFRADPDEAFIRWPFAIVTALVIWLAIPELVVGATSGIAIAGTAVPRIAGPLEGPNQLAGYLGLTLPVLLAYTLLHGKRSFEIFVIAGGCIATVFTFSRAGIAALLLALCIVAMQSVRSRRVREIFAALAVATLAGSIAAWKIVAGGPAPLHAHHLRISGGLGTRQDLWHAAYGLWIRHPIWGIGAGNFELEVGPFLHAPIRTHTNSLYLQSLVEGGLPLFAATLFLVYRSIVTFARRAAAPLVIAAFAASIALAFHQILDYLIFYPKVGMAWAILLGIACGELAAGNRLAISGKDHV